MFVEEGYWRQIFHLKSWAVKAGKEKALERRELEKNVRNKKIREGKGKERDQSAEGWREKEKNIHGKWREKRK